MKRPTDGPTWLYTMLCEHGRELYVGIACNLERRIDQHRYTKLWWPQVWGIQALQLPTRQEARSREVDAIARLRPKYNIADVPRTRGTGDWESYRRFLIEDGRPVPISVPRPYSEVF